MSARLVAVVIAFTLSNVLAAQTPTSPEALLKAAQQREQIDGDWRGALADYKILVNRFPDDASGAHALMRIGGIHERNGDRQLALEAYQQALKHPRAAAVGAAARARVKALAVSEVTLDRRRLAKVPEGLGEYGRLSPDGQWMSFNDTASKIGSGNLAIWNLATGQSQLLTGEPCCEWTNGYSETSAWSAKGDALAYAWRKTRVTDLRVVSRTGGRVRVLLDAAAVERLAESNSARGAWIEPFAWSPDGAFVLAGVGVFEGPGVVARTQLIRVSVRDGTATSLRPLGPRSYPTYASYSPDGKYIAYDYRLAEDAAGRDVFVMTADGVAHQTVVRDASSDDMLMGWTPDGSHLLYAGDRLGRRDVWAMPMTAGRAGGQPFLVVRDVGDLLNRGLAANARFLGEVRLNQSDIFVTTVDAQGSRFASAPAPLSRAQAGVARSQGTWSPGGDRIAYFQGGAGRPHALVVQNATSGSIRLYPLAARNSERPVWHPDGQSIAFNAVGDKDAQAVFVLNLATEKVTQVATGPQVAFSPDGRFLYYVGGQGIVQRRNLADDTESVAARSGGVAAALKLSPDGRHFAIYRGQIRGIVLLPADGVGEPKILGQGIERAQNHLAWSPDGRFVLFVVGPGEIWRVSADGGTPERIGALTERAGVIKHLNVAADGKLAMSIAGYDSELWLWNNLPALVNRR